MASSIDRPAMRAPSPAYSDASHTSASRPSVAVPSSSQHRASTSTSTGSRYASNPKPVDEAVTTALDHAQSQTSSQISPELIAQITQNVIKQLQQTGLEANAPPASSSHPAPIVHQPTPQSPSTTASATSPSMPNRVLTPPSPHRNPELSRHKSPPLHSSERSAEPIRLPAKPASTSDASRYRASSPSSQESDNGEKDHDRPRGPARLDSTKEETTLERIWGQLFDEHGESTARLGQLLRGLADHIIEHYEPKNSLIITPDKMAKYYQDVKLSVEAYPWLTVFDDEQTSISRMYRDLECQHHLVQEKYDQRPDIPGLTPVGFERWATLLIQAHPDAEFDRLKKAVLEMPISNPDDRKERFPKEISRRLFPLRENSKVRHMIEDSISERAAIVIPRRSSDEHLSSQQQSPTRRSRSPSDSQASNQPQRPSVSFADQVQTSSTSTSHAPSNIERERKPYSNVPSESAIDDTNPSSSQTLPANTHPAPIERERKPYIAQPGGGKHYEDDLSRPPASSFNSNGDRESSRSRAEPILSTGTARPTRADSNARARPMSISQTRPMDIPKPEVHHHRAPSNAGSNVSGQAPSYRRRSPSFSRNAPNDYRRSEADLRGYQPASFEHQGSSVPRGGGGEGVMDESDTRRYFEKQARERAERIRRDDDARNLGDFPRRSESSVASSSRRDGHFAPGDDDYHRASTGGRGYDYQQPYGGPVYR